MRRAATAKDFRLARQLIEEHYAWAVPAAGYDDLAEAAPSVAEEIERLDEHYSSSPSARLFVAGFGDGDPVGVCAIERLDDRSAELKRLYVQPDARGRGVARSLIAAVTQAARDMGCSELRLDTHEGIMQPAIALYRSLGFVESDRRCTDIDAGGMVALELPLTARRVRMPLLRRFRAGAALGCVALAGLLGAASLPASHAAAAVSEAQPPTTAQAAFPPGIWMGVAVITGTISGENIDAWYNAPAHFDFQLEVAPEGTVGGAWTVTADVAGAGPDGQGAMTFSGSGELTGVSSYVELSGSMHATGTVVVEGVSVPVDVDVPVDGYGFSPTSASCAVVTGDLATEGRDVQSAAGFATTVTGPFTAHRVGDIGEGLAPGFQETYIELVAHMHRLKDLGAPPAADVMDLARRVETFYVNLFNHAGTACAGGAGQLAPGTFWHAYFAKEVGTILVAALADPSGYSTGDLYLIGLAAQRIGLIGSGAADQNLAMQVETLLLSAFGDRLDGAEAEGDADECTNILVAAETFGFTTLKTRAMACSGG